MGFLDEWSVNYMAFIAGDNALSGSPIDQTDGYLEQDGSCIVIKVDMLHQFPWDVYSYLTASRAVDIGTGDFDVSFTITPLHTLWQGYYTIRGFHFGLSNFDITSDSPQPIEGAFSIVFSYIYDHENQKAYWGSSLTAPEEVPLTPLGDIPRTYSINCSRTNGLFVYQGIGKQLIDVVLEDEGNKEDLRNFAITHVWVVYNGVIVPLVDPDVETETAARFTISGSIFTPPPLPRVPQPRWDGYKLMWEEVPDARSYAIKLYKNGIGTENLADFRIVPAGQKFFDYSALYNPDTGLFTAGKYRATVQALPTLPPEGGG